MTNSNVTNFFYKGTKDSFYYPRQIYKMNETKNYIQGFDFGVLSPKERNLVKKTFKNRKVLKRFATASNPAKISDDPEIAKIVKKAWRNFKTDYLHMQSGVNVCAEKCEGINSAYSKKELKEILSKLGTKNAIRKAIERAFKNWANEEYRSSFAYKGYRFVKYVTTKGELKYQVVKPNDIGE